MYSVELYSRVRRACHVDGMSARKAARQFGLDRKTVSKILKHSVPPGYRRKGPPIRPKLDPFVGIIDQILLDDKSVHKKQRHTAKRIFERLRDEHGFTGGVPLSMLYDNTTIAVAKICGDGKRVRTTAFSELQSHYLFEDKFGRPGKGNDKGMVEGVVGYGRRNFLVPAPRFDSFDDLNARLEEQCLKRQDDVVRGHGETIGERLMRDLDALMPLPPVPYDL